MAKKSLPVEVDRKSTAPLRHSLEQMARFHEARRFVREQCCVSGRRQLDVEAADPRCDLFRRNALAQHEADETVAEAVEGQSAKLGVLCQPREEPVHPAFRVACLSVFANGMVSAIQAAAWGGCCEVSA